VNEADKSLSSLENMLYFHHLNSESYTTNCIFFCPKTSFANRLYLVCTLCLAPPFCLLIEKEIRKLSFYEFTIHIKKNRSKTWSLTFCKIGRKHLSPQSQLSVTILHQMQKAETSLKSKAWLGPLHNNKQSFAFLKVLNFFQILLYFLTILNFNRTYSLLSLSPSS